MQTENEPQTQNQSPAPNPKRKPFAALQYRDYRLLWLGQGVSQIGTQMRIVAIAWQIYHLTHDPLSLGFIGLCRVVPLIASSLLGGTIADAVDRRKLLLVCQAVLFFCSVSLFLVTITGIVTVWWIYGITIASSAVNGFERPANSALIPALVPRHQLANALSLSTLNWQIAMVSGPGLGGLIIWGLDVQGAYLIDSFSFVGVIVALLFIHYRPSGPSGTRISLEAAIEGFRFVWGKKILVATMVLDFVATFFGSATTLLPIFASEILKVDELGYGLLTASEAAGAVIASFVLAWLQVGRTRHPGRWVIGAVLLYSFFTILFGFSTWLPLSMFWLALVGASDTVSMVLRQTISQLVTPDHMRGRMQSVNMIFFAGGPQLGEVEAGIVARISGAQFSVISGGFACVVMVIAVGLFSRSLRDYEFDK